MLPQALKTRLPQDAGSRWQIGAETLIVVVSLFLAATANNAFLGAVLHGRSLLVASTWAHGLALVGLLAAAHTVVLVLLGLLAPGRWLKGMVGVLLVVAAAASYYIQSFGAVLDPSMMRNVLHTDPPEAAELLTAGLALHLLLYAGLPVLALWRVQLRRRSWARAVLWRSGLALAGLALFTGCLLAIFPSFGPLMRNQKELRYLATPTNVLWSTGAVAAQQLRGAAKPRQAIGLDAQPGPAMAARQQPGARPLVVVMVVGETARAANWGLTGYPRNTTPQLAQWPLMSWRHATSCGTNTETSVPCMFAPVGRRDYDEDTIRGSESLLHVVARAGVAVHWRDNQSGCKGTCDGLPQDHVKDLKLPALCEEAHCLDEGLLAGLEERLAKAQGTQLLVLHMLGNHGPAYFKRHPPAFEQFKPTCRTEDLRKCSREEITNAYDNALLYTDHVLARLLATLKAAQGVDTAVVFASDHGESLGENNLYLHGLPFAIAPNVQKQVPMFLWLSDGLAGGLARRSLATSSLATGSLATSTAAAASSAAAPTAGPPSTGPAALEAACLQQRRQQAGQQTAAHDHLFHTLLGLLDVKTGLYEPAWDLLQSCRKP